MKQNNNTRNHALPDGMQHYEPLRLLRRAAHSLRLSDSALSQYELLLSYTKAIDWRSGNLCICWMSVQKIAEKLTKCDCVGLWHRPEADPGTAG